MMTRRTLFSCLTLFVIAIASAASAFVPDDPGYPNQWGLPRIGMEDAWEFTRGRPEVVIAILDTGLEYTHPDAPPNYRADLSHDFVGGDADPLDGHGHGTHNAGTIAAATDNALGVAGVADAVGIMAVKVLNDAGGGTHQRVADGIDWAIAHGAKIICMPFSGSDDAIMAAAVDRAHSAGALMIAEAGNNNTSSTTFAFPAAYDAVLAVTAISSSNTRASFSNFGTWVDLAAPGVAIFSTYRGGGYQSLSATSMAAAHVCGVAGIVWSSRLALNPTAAEIREILEENAEDLGDPGFDSLFGHGLVRAVPEPTRGLQLGAGIALLVLLRRARRPAAGSGQNVTSRTQREPSLIYLSSSSSTTTARSCAPCGAARRW